MYYLRWTHFACALLLLVAKVNKARDVEAHPARIFEFVTVPLYAFALMFSFGVSKEKIPFESKTIRPSETLTCTPAVEGSAQAFITMEMNIFGANLLRLMIYLIRSRIYTDQKSLEIETIR